LPDDTELLEQRVTKRKQKLEQAAAVVSLVQDRVATATAADEESGRELRTLRAALEAAEKKAKRLKKRTRQARALSGSAEEDRLAAERELAEELQRYDKRQAKLAKAEAALAAALATRRVEEAAPLGATQDPAQTTAPVKRSAPVRKTAPRKRTVAATKKTTSTTGRTTSTGGTTKKATAAKAPAAKAPARKASTRARKTT
jgi:chromosome segregation ATPase